MDEREILDVFTDLRRETLQVWIDRGWVTPERREQRYTYREVDVARIRLIREFRHDLALDDEALDVILPLLDQVHGLRHQLRRLVDAIGHEPDDVRRRVAARLAGR